VFSYVLARAARLEPVWLLRIEGFSNPLSPAFSAFLYRYRNLDECFFNKIKHFRAIATRYEKHDANYLALVKFASTRIWVRFMSR